MSHARPSCRTRVLFASHGVDLGGGAEQCLVELLDVLHHRSDLAAHVVAPESGPFRDVITALGVPCDVLTTPRWVTTAPEGFGRPQLQNLARRARMMRGVVRLSWPWIAFLRRVRPDVVVTNTAFSPAAAFAARSLRIPHVWWLHEFVRDPGATGTLGLVGPDFALGQPLAARTIGALSERVVATSQAVADEFASHITNDKVRVIHPGIAEPAASPNRIEPGALHILGLGRQTPAKGTDVAVRALAAASEQVPGLSLRLVGSIDPTYRALIESLAAELGVRDRIELVDYCPDPTPHFDWANVVLMCSIREAFGRATAEALVRGRPVIGTRVGGTVEIVTDGVDGLLVDPGDVPSLADAIVRLASTPGLLDAMSGRAVERNRGRFTVSALEVSFNEAIRAAVDSR